MTYKKNLSRLLQGKRFDNIAAATQSWFETLISKWIESAVKKTNIRKIVCAGGTFLNVKANQSILNLECIDDAFFLPCGKMMKDLQLVLRYDVILKLHQKMEINQTKSH